MAQRKRKHHYHDGGSGVWGKIFLGLGLLLLAALIIGGAYFLAVSGPGRVVYNDKPADTASEIPADVTAMLDKSRELERTFLINEKVGAMSPEERVNFENAIYLKKKNHAIASVSLTPEDQKAADTITMLNVVDISKISEVPQSELDNLRQAIQLQKNYLDQTNGHDSDIGNERIEEMTALLEFHETQPMRRQSLDLEKRADDLENSQDYDGARNLLQQAADLEDAIVKQFAASKLSLTAAGRSVVLHHHIDFLTAQPLYNQSLADEVTAKAAIDRKDWATAQDKYQSAYDIQARLNRDYPDQHFTDSARLLRLKSELFSLRSLPQHQQIEKLITDGQAADAAGDATHAAELFQEAQRQQRDLIANFPDSRFADSTVIDTIENLLQTASSRPIAMEIRAQAADLADALRQRHIPQAIDLITVLFAKTQHFHDNFPRSALLDDNLQQRIEYLNARRNDFQKIQDQVYAQLLAIPGQQRLLLYKQEVSQSLFLAVTGSNPSRNQGPDLPVDSVNWTEAKDFCQRLSWILSRPVRLPTIDEFHAALGNVALYDPLTMSWNLDNSKGATQPVGTKTANVNGFYDLLGNVAEWLERPDDVDEDQAPVIGGNVQTHVDEIRNAPRTTNLSNDVRNPFIGFRIVVDGDASAPLLPPAPAALTLVPSANPPPSATTPAGVATPKVN